MRRIHSSPLRFPTIFLWVLEGLLIAVTFGALGYYSFASTSFIGQQSHTFPLTVMVPLAVVGMMHWGGLYDSDALLNLRRAIWRSALIAAPIFVVAVWATGQMARKSNIPIYPYRWEWTIGLTAIWWATVIALRALFSQIHRNGWLTRRVLVIGTAESTAALSDLSLEASGQFAVSACLDVERDRSVLQSRESLRTRLIPLVTEKRISEIVIAERASDHISPGALVDCAPAGMEVTRFLDFFEREAGRVCLDELGEDQGSLPPGLSGSQNRAASWRLFDIVFALLGIVATAPVMLMTALAIKLEDGGRVFYGQERVGLGGRSFTVLKFRSMREDAERDGTPMWAAERDSRITHVGRIIRKLRIDELPQFFNVLQGDMAIVGPRPERPYFVAQFVESIPFYRHRHAVRPGITGWAQVKFRYGASLDDTKRKLSYDLYYIKNRSMLLDLMILMKTVGVVLRGEGAR